MLRCLIITDATAADPAILRGIFQLRHKVFSVQRQWVPAQSDGLERDHYDNLPPVHFAIVDASKRVLGCLRMKPTSGPYMFRDIFPVLAGRNALPSQQNIWEISRFSVDEHCMEYGASASVSLVTNMLLQAIFSYAMQHNITSLLGVTDLAFERLLRRAGLYTVRYSPPRRIGNCTAVAGYAEVTPALVELLEQRGTEIEQARYLPLPPSTREGVAA